MENLPDYEKIGSFYLGKKYELAGRRLLDEKVLYDAKDLTTHAMCVGMTGSGKTGLCLSLLEEAAIDGIPAICLDPKGDLGNLLLAFPNLAPGDFKPWLEASEASRKGLDLDQYAQETATKWRDGLQSWDQDADRVRRYVNSVDMAIYTPGSNSGIPMTVLKSFDAPPQEVIDDSEVMRERVAGAASGLLTLMGITADPLSSREHILLSNIFDMAWRAGRNLDLPDLIRSIQTPPMDKIGVFDLESFYPSSERLKLSMSLNNLLASPSFGGWLEGAQLDIKKLLYTDQGKPRLSIISIAHLSDSERMFFVTILLNELLGWMRTQPGTSSLRALFYMDEVYGYFPPVSKPPSKPPMLVLLKQARAFGLGIVLATQNPVDLDYKGLSNIGTWFLGRLQTQRDKERVLEGLEGAAAQTGTRFDRGAMEQTLAALGNRVFLMNNVHDHAPTIFQTRWAMSYLRGPLSRDQIQTLMEPRRHELSRGGSKSTADVALVSSTQATAPALAENSRPIVPNDVAERFWLPSKPPLAGRTLVYHPGLLATVSCHYVRVSADLDTWVDRSLVYQLDRKLANDVWLAAREMPPGVLELSGQPEDGYGFSELPGEMLNSKQYKSWEKDLADHLYRRVPAKLFQCEEIKKTSQLGQSELDARLSWGHEIRELRDAEKEKLRAKYAGKLDSLESKIRTAQQRLDRERAQYDQQKWNTVLNVGQTLLGMLVGNKVRSRSATAGRSLGRAAQERSDTRLANDQLQDLMNERYKLEHECDEEVRALGERYRPESLTLEAIEVPCRKGDVKVNLLALLWIPYEVDTSGIASPLVALPV
ncbi:MAG: ATP-binding protein [Pirellulaceae bacterium]